jgi:hypothetical protein
MRKRYFPDNSVQAATRFNHGAEILALIQPALDGLAQNPSSPCLLKLTQDQSTFIIENPSLFEVFQDSVIRTSYCVHRLFASAVLQNNGGSVSIVIARDR